MSLSLIYIYSNLINFLFYKIKYTYLKYLLLFFLLTKNENEKETNKDDENGAKENRLSHKIANF